MPSKILQLPTRVSRLYPIFSLILLFTSGIFYYAWQTTEISLNNLPKVEERNKDLEKQIEALTVQQKVDQATLQVQKQRITDTAAQLAELEKSLNQKEQEISAKTAQIKKQEGQLAQNATDLENLRNRPPLFSFQNKSTLADVAQKQADIKDLVTNTFTYIQDLYGNPYLLSSIKITFVDEFSIAGSAGEIVIENGPKGISIDIHLKDFDKESFQDINTVIHEMIHGFHGVAVFESSALEEGMTVAATDAVMQKMIADGKLPEFSHLYIYLNDQQYTDYNRSLSISNDNEVFYSSPQVAKVYQLIGKAWYRLWEEDHDFFKKLNTAYYAKVQRGIAADNALVLDAIRSVLPRVDGQSIDTYLSSNRAFYPN